MDSPGQDEEFWGTGEEVIFHDFPGWVRLVDHMGGDLSVVNNARESFGREVQALSEGDIKLIDFLLRNRHGTPFEAVVFAFQVACPIFVAREWFRHRVGSFNEMSGRYVKLKPVFYLPRTHRTQVGKPGAYRYEDMEDQKSGIINLEMMETYQHAWLVYEQALRNGTAKELARLPLPVAIFTEFRWIVNARSLMNFLNLRLAKNAMFEIRQLAWAVNHHFVAIAPHTARAFEDHGRIAP